MTRPPRFSTALTAALCVLGGAAQAQVTTLPLAQRTDLVHDGPRELVYIVSGRQILRYSLTANSYLSPILLGSIYSGKLLGIDLSPDGNLLLVTDEVSDTAGTNRVWRIDLSSETIAQVTFPLAFYEGGTHAVAFGNDGKALITSKFLGSGSVPLRQYDPTTGAVAVIASSVNQNTMVSASADGSKIAFAEANSSDGPWGNYDVLTGNFTRRQWYTDGTSWFNYEVATSRNGQQIAIPTYGGTFLYNSAYQKVATFGTYADEQPIGVAFHPQNDELYCIWNPTGDIHVYDTQSFSLLQVLPFALYTPPVYNQAYQHGRIKFSRDGSLLLGTTTDGVRLRRLYAPLTATSTSGGTNEDSALNVSLNGSVGLPGGSVGFQVLSGPTHGTLSGTAPNLIYTPAPNYHGPDSFTFAATLAPNAVSPTATVSLSVASVNDAPVALSDSATCNEDSGPLTLTVLSNDSDADGEPLQLVSVSAASGGVVQLQGDQLVYTPRANWNGTDSFTYTVRDAAGALASATVTVGVSPVNDAPIAVNDSASTKRNTARVVDVKANDSDPDGDVLTVIAVSGATNGTATLNANGTVTFTPARNFTGTAQFTYTLRDTSGATASARATISVTR